MPGAIFVLPLSRARPELPIPTKVEAVNLLFETKLRHSTSAAREAFPKRFRFNYITREAGLAYDLHIEPTD
jgi:hypothetical protein